MDTILHRATNILLLKKLMNSTDITLHKDIKYSFLRVPLSKISLLNFITTHQELSVLKYMDKWKDRASPLQIHFMYFLQRMYKMR